MVALYAWSMDMENNEILKDTSSDKASLHLMAHSTTARAAHESSDQYIFRVISESISKVIISSYLFSDTKIYSWMTRPNSEWEL